MTNTFTITLTDTKTGTLTIKLPDTLTYTLGVILPDTLNEIFPYLCQISASSLLCDLSG